MHSVVSVCKDLTMRDSDSNVLQMTERFKVQQQEQEASWQQQKQLLKAQEEDLASWKADADRQLSLQQVGCSCSSRGKDCAIVVLVWSVLCMLLSPCHAW